MTALHRRDDRPDPRLERTLRRLLGAGLLLVLALPAARGTNAWLGAWPLWLLAMPAASWWALHRFRWPHAATATRPRRRRGGQARRRTPAAARRAWARAA